MPIDIRILTHVREFSRIPDLEIAVWGLPAKDVVASNIIRALTLNGGVAHGVFDGDTMIGMALAFSARRDGRQFMWSHMAAVIAAYQGQGIGFRLKQAQRDWALAQGYDEMRWTFDPIQRGNAHFNLHLLGVTSGTYHIDFYGQMEDALNVAAPTDRLEALWKLKDRRVVRLAAGGTPKAFTGTISAERLLLHRDERGQPVISGLYAGPGDLGISPDVWTRDIAARHEEAFVELPPNRAAFKALTAEGVLAWRMALRMMLTGAFGAGFRAVDLVEQDGRSFYRLEAPEAWHLYVLECSDGSLYTGIAREVDKRLAQHNAGHGAAYTAARRPVRLLASWTYRGRGMALKAEAAFKAQTRAEKLTRIASGGSFLEGTKNPM